MREIKFRAWGKPYSEMLEVVCIDYDQKSAQVRDNDTWWEDFKNIELMQYTGLKDSKGIEIYEGDILKVRMNKDCCENLEVCFSYGSFYAKGTSCDNNELGYSTFLSNVTHECEVIGNIYEHPELLEV